MPRVLVFGATGYLGQAVTEALVRSGLHTVYGLSRSANKSKTLAAREVIPVVCADPANAPEPYLDAIRKSRIDVVVDCTAAYGDSAKFLTQVKSVGQERLDTFKADGISSPPKIGFIYVSGAWVHGESDAHVTDLDPVGTKSAPSPPQDLVAWRPELERLALAAREVLDVLIIRPGMMYGRSSSAWSPVWGPIAQAVTEGKSSIQVPIAPSSLSPFVHVDDVADGILRGVGKISMLSGTNTYPVFDLASTLENVRDVLDAFANALLAKGGKSEGLKLDLVGPGDNVYTRALGSTVKCNSARAREFLNWEPKRLGLVAGMEVYARAWEAGQ